MEETAAKEEGHGRKHLMNGEQKQSKKKVAEKEEEEQEEGDELMPLNPTSRSVQPSRLGSVKWCHCKKCVPMTSETASRCCHEDEEVWHRILEEGSSSGSSNSHASFSCVVDHPFFATVCRNPYALQALYSRDRWLFGDMSDVPLHEKYRITSYRAFVEFYYGRLLEEPLPVMLPSCAASTIQGLFPHHAFVMNVPGYLPM